MRQRRTRKATVSAVVALAQAGETQAIVDLAPGLRTIQRAGALLADAHSDGSEARHRVAGALVTLARARALLGPVEARQLSRGPVQLVPVTDRATCWIDVGRLGAEPGDAVIVDDGGRIEVVRAEKRRQ